MWTTLLIRLRPLSVPPRPSLPHKVFPDYHTTVPLAAKSQATTYIYTYSYSLVGLNSSKTSVFSFLSGHICFLSRKPQSQAWTHLPGFSGRPCSPPWALLRSGKTGGSACWSCSLDRPRASHLSPSEKTFYLGERSLISDDYGCSVQHHEVIDWSPSGQRITAETESQNDFPSNKSILLAFIYTA